MLNKVETGGQLVQRAGFDEAVNTKTAKELLKNRVAESVLGGPVRGTVDSWHPGFLLCLVIDFVGGTTDLALAVDPWHRFELVQGMLKTLQSPGCRKEAT